MRPASSDAGQGVRARGAAIYASSIPTKHGSRSKTKSEAIPELMSSNPQRKATVSGASGASGASRASKSSRSLSLYTKSLPSSPIQSLRKTTAMLEKSQPFGALSRLPDKHRASKEPRAVSDGFQEASAAKPLSELRTKAVKSFSSNRDQFGVTESALRAYLKRGKIETLLSSFGLSQSDAPRIHEKCIRIFSTLLAIEQGEFIKIFIENGLSDASLPFSQAPECWPWPHGGEPASFSKLSDFHSHFSMWNDFFREQWQFRPATLEVDQHHSFRSESLPPTCSKTPSNEGGSAEVHSIQIDSKHQHLDKPHPSRMFPRKIISSRGTSRGKEEAFKCELDALQASKDHPHIVKVLETYQHGETYNILPDHSDTLQDWMQKTKPPKNEENILMFWSSFLKLLRPLQRIHETNLRTDHDDKSEILQG